MKYIKKIARFILKNELNDLNDKINILEKDHRKFQNKIKKLEDPENILLKNYRIDNININGMPPSYLSPDNKNEYIQKISELESIYRNKTFRELMAWSLNFHANLAITGHLKNEYGDIVEIKPEEGKYMIQGIRSIWELIVAAHNKDKEMREEKIVDLFEDNI